MKSEVTIGVYAIIAGVLMHYLGAPGWVAWIVMVLVAGCLVYEEEKRNAKEELEERIDELKETVEKFHERLENLEDRLEEPESM
jgi:membrane protein implicated in regulation of membrane protease activity